MARIFAILIFTSFISCSNAQRIRFDVYFDDEITSVEAVDDSSLVNSEHVRRDVYPHKIFRSKKGHYVFRDQLGILFVFTKEKKLLGFYANNYLRVDDIEMVDIAGDTNEEIIVVWSGETEFFLDVYSIGKSDVGKIFESEELAYPLQNKQILEITGDSVFINHYSNSGESRSKLLVSNGEIKLQ